uniref:Uncharacterized protein n=1 Tax=Megaselia scalaris TaxID=36166 RepID=T1GK35_MEGSC
MSTLPERYDSFVTAIKTRDTLPVLKFLITKVLGKESRKTDRETEAETSNVFGAKFISKPRNNQKCMFCKEKGYLESKCGRKLGQNSETAAHITSKGNSLSNSRITMTKFVYATGIGNIEITNKYNGKVNLQDVLHVPDLTES